MENNMFVTLNVDVTKYPQKPSDDDIRNNIQRKLAVGKDTITVEDLVGIINVGGSFKAAALNGAKNKNWESQQVFALDLDNKGADIVYPQDIVNRFIGLGITPAFYYYTFNSKPEIPKFRVVFVSESIIEDIRIRNAVQFALMTICPESDRACKDLSRLFFGTNSPCIPVGGFNSTFSPFNLIQGMVAYVKETDSVNYNRTITNYCKTVGLNMINNLPDVRLVEDIEVGENTCNAIDNSKGQKVEENTATFIYYYRACAKIFRFNFSVTEDQEYSLTEKSEGKKSHKKTDVNNVKEKREPIRNFDFNELENNCQLWSEYTNGNRWCYHNEIFGIATNMWNVEGAETRMIKAIEDNDKYANQYNKINTIKSCGSYGYTPQRCENFCPFHSTCSNNGINMLHSVGNKRGNIRKVEDDVTGKALTDAQDELREVIEDAYNSQDNDIHVIIGATGLGKTTVYGSLNLENTVLCYPNHKLGDDIVDRVSCKNAIHVKELNISDKTALAEFRRLQSIGGSRQANQSLEKWIQRTGSKCSQNNQQAYQQFLDDQREIRNYQESIKESKTTKKNIFCTHARLIDLDNPNIKTAIIDEDIVLSSLINILELKADSLEAMIKMAKSSQATTTTVHLETLLETVKIALAKPTQVFELPSALINTKEVNGIISNNKDSLDQDIKKILRINRIVADVKGNVAGIYVGELPEYKCIILSATINPEVIRALYPNRTIHVKDIGLVETQGEIVLHYTSASRSALSKNLDKIVEQVKEESPGIYNVITFKKFASAVKNAGFNPILTFGTEMGIDTYKGQDLIILGTNHVNPIVYQLIASSIVPNIRIESSMKYSNVRRNGFEFSLMTYTCGNTGNTQINDLLQNIQFYYLESSLEQAIGRARVLRYKCTVHVYASFPPKGCKLYKK